MQENRPDDRPQTNPSKDDKDSAKRTSLRDVAEKAGVGLGTASRALSGDFAVRMDTALKVREAAEELGYNFPSPERRPLPEKKGATAKNRLKNGVIAFLLPDRRSGGLQTVLSQSLLRGIESYFFDRKLRVIGTSFNEDGSLPQCLAKKQVDGYILRGELHPLEFTEKTKKALQFLPGVNVMWAGVETPTDIVLPDFEAIGRMAALHLIKQGRKRLVCVNVLDHRREIGTCAHGFMHECQIRGVEVTMIRRQNPGIIQAEMGTAVDVARELIALPFRPDGIFTPNELLPLMPALNELKWKRPKQFDFCVSIGCKDSAKQYVPTDTTFIHQQTEQVGCAAAEQLLWRIDNPFAKPYKILIDPEIMMNRDLLK